MVLRLEMTKEETQLKFRVVVFLSYFKKGSFNRGNFFRFPFKFERTSYSYKLLVVILFIKHSCTHMTKYNFSHFYLKH